MFVSAVVSPGDFDYPAPAILLHNVAATLASSLRTPPAMPTHDPNDEDWYDDEDADADAALPCPECGAVIYDDLDHCPKCGYWITDADRQAQERSSGFPRVVRIVAIVMIAIFLATLLLAGAMF
jgi:hypothetical protein